MATGWIINPAPIPERHFTIQTAPLQLRTSSPETMAFFCGLNLPLSGMPGYQRLHCHV